MHFRSDKYLVTDAILASLGILLGYIEMLLIPYLFFPGIKLGLSNIVILLALLTLRKRDAFCIGIIKSLVNGLAFSGFTSCIYSVCGLIFSFVVMVLLKPIYEKGKISAIGISVVGSALFNSGQVFAAILVLGTMAPIYYLNYYLFVSIVTGIVTGLVVQIILNKGVVNRIEKKK